MRFHCIPECRKCLAELQNETRDTLWRGGLRSVVKATGENFKRSLDVDCDDDSEEVGRNVKKKEKEEKEESTTKVLKEEHDNLVHVFVPLLLSVTANLSQ